MDKNPLLIPLIVLSVFFVGVAGFGIWSYLGMMDYKNNYEQKSAVDVQKAEEELTLKKDAEFAEKYKDPFMVYVGPQAYGTLTITYPKNWSNYVKQDDGSALLDGFMQKDFVPSDNETTNYALRYQVTRTQYDQELRAFESKVKSGKISSFAYSSPKQPNATAIRFEGEIQNKKQGVMVLIKSRDKTIKLWTEGDSAKQDFEKILSELTFVE